MAQMILKKQYMEKMLKAISLVFGKIFSVVSPLSNLNNCIPPIFNNGITVIAITTIPIPPSHCRRDRQISIAFGALFKSCIIVDPVVVIPDMLSKKASLKVSSRFEKINGSYPKMAILVQEREVNKKAC